MAEKVENIFTFHLPDIGEGVVEGEVVEWLKKVGDPVKKDEPVVVIMTDKATVELPSPYPGTLSKQYHQPGEIAVKDRPLYDIQLAPGTGATGPEENSKELKEAEGVQTAPKSEASAKAMPSSETVPHGKALATPKVRHLAHEIGIDLEQVKGTGREGRVTFEDLHQQPMRNEAIPKLERQEGDVDQPLIGIRGLMARRMDQTHIPQFSWFSQVDVTRLIQMRQKFMVKAQSENIRLSFMPFLIRALSLTAKKYPLINSSIDMKAAKVILHRNHHIGIATASEQGLIVPVLKDVHEMGLEQIIRSYEDLKNKTLAGKLASSDMKGATITMSNFGSLSDDALWATPLISDPEVAILAIGRMQKIPAVKNHEVVVKDVLPLSWSFDHRVIDGELAAMISHYFATLLRDPALLL